MAYFRPPQKKKCAGSVTYRPFPIPIASITKVEASTKEWNYYDGYLADDSVLVKKKGDARALYSQVLIDFITSYTFFFILTVSA